MTEKRLLKTKKHNQCRWGLWAFVLACACFHARGETLVFPPYGHSYGIRKATKAHLFMFFGPRTFFRDPQGLATAKMISRDDSTTEKDDDEVVVYGVNAGRHELIYNSSMWTLALYGEKGGGVGEFMNPKGVACDIKGNVYVADCGNNRIVHLFNPKRKLEWVKSFDGAGEGRNGLNSPSQVGITQDGHIYVTDTGNRRIVRFDPNGAVMQTIPAQEARFSFVDGPTTLAVADGRHPWSYYRGERFIFCADSGGKRLWKIGFDGRVLKKVTMPEEYSACYGAVDYYHSLLVTDKTNHCILKFSHDLELLDIFGKRGTGDNEFIEPRGIAVWKRYGQTFVAEKAGAQYYWMGTDLKNHKLKVLGEGRYCLNTYLTDHALATLFVVTGEDTVKLFSHKTIRPGARQTIFATSKDVEGKDLMLRVEPTYSSRTYFHWDYPVKAVP
ncbi:MAG: hypothetical protein GF344_09205 [Chitinivibrionales bacterium]|nr:hypothetical protein [Chitinivibrionales bacterium]MBD3357028.1 hypothetical protein [Chitinivibrionales bacterium]